MIEKKKETVLVSLPMDFKELRMIIHFIYLGDFCLIDYTFWFFIMFYECMVTSFVVYFPNTLIVLVYLLCTGIYLAQIHFQQSTALSAGLWTSTFGQVNP